MALLDMQGMDPASRGGGGGSVVSLLLCDSALSTTLCL
jgi:Lanthionine-containing peptide SapB precursor RamS